MPHALARLRPRLALGLAASLTLACGRGSGGGAAGDPALAAIHARMPPIDRPEVGAQAPGFVEGGLLYLAVRPGDVQKYLQALPLDPDTARDLAKAGVDLGFDPRVDDVTARLGLDPERPITATILRPIAPQLPGVREALTKLQSAPPAPNPFPGVTPADIAPMPIERRPPRPPPPPEPVAPIEPPSQPIYDRLEPPPIQPPPDLKPLQPTPSADQEAMSRGAGAMALHSRAHLPAKDPAALPALLNRMIRKPRGPEVTTLCSQIGPSEFCFGDSDAVLVVRKEEAAVLVDLFLFPAGTGATWDPERVTNVTRGLAAAPASLAPLASLRGDFALYADGAAFPAVAELAGIADAVSDLRWLPPGEFGFRLDRSLRERAALDQLRETRRLFAGVRLEAAIEGDTVQATLAWEPVDAAAAAEVSRVFTRAPTGVKVPTLAALCDGALACWRTSGLPPFAALGDLAIGQYARPAPQFGELVSSAGDLGGLVLFFETWPNALGMLQKWGESATAGMEGAMARTALDIAGRVEGSGGSLRSLQLGDRNVQTDYATYVRMQGQDLALFRSLVGFAGLTFAKTDVAGVTAKIESARPPDNEVPANFYLVTDPGTLRLGDRDVEMGWLAAADGPDRLKWLLADVEHAESSGPAGYLELPDLWKLVASTKDAGEANFLQSWLSGRSFKAALDVVGGSVRLDFELARKAAP